MMALHRGRLDLLEAHLRRDPALLRRSFSLAEIFPPELGCQQPAPGSDGDLPRTPLAGATLLQACVEFDELELARWLLAHGAPADARAAVDAAGFGGHTALFNAVASYPNFWMNFTGGWPGTRKPQQADFAELLLSHGAGPNAQASLRETVKTGSGVTVREHRDVTPIGSRATGLPDPARGDCELGRTDGVPRAPVPHGLTPRPASPPPPSPAGSPPSCR